MPQAPGFVTLRQALDAFGHAHWWLPELHVPQAPCPAGPHGPKELPQQNHVVSPRMTRFVPHAIVPLHFSNRKYLGGAIVGRARSGRYVIQEASAGQLNAV